MNEDVLKVFDRLNTCNEMLSIFHEIQRNLFDEVKTSKRGADLSEYIEALDMCEKQSHDWQLRTLEIANNLLGYIRGAGL